MKKKQCSHLRTEEIHVLLAVFLSDLSMLLNMIEYKILENVLYLQVLLGLFENTKFPKVKNHEELIWFIASLKLM